MITDLFVEMEREGFEEVVVFHDRNSGLKAIVAIHTTSNSTATGGTRMWKYPSFKDALGDVLSLARAMTFKCIGAGIDFGGGKAVIVGDPERDKTKELLKSYAEFIQSLGGKFVTGEDVGITNEDVRFMRRYCDYLTGVNYDPSPFTAYGVLHGMRACLKSACGDESFEGVHVAVQGAGKVGMELARLLIESGARVTVSDLSRERLEACRSFGAECVEPDEIYRVECDIFSPCALGGVIDDETARNLRCRIVAGSANNQLKSTSAGKILAERGVLYAPDFIINAGGLITVANEYIYKEIDETKLRREIEGIGERLAEVFRLAERLSDERGEVVSTHQAAIEWAMEKMRAKSEKKHVISGKYY